MWMMLEPVDSLLKVYKSIRPLISLWVTTCQRRRVAVMDPDNWAIVRDATVGHDVKETLFYIPLNRSTGQPLKLKEAATPYVYDRFIGAWGMFPHHE